SAALAEGPAHAYLLHGPAGVGKRDLALLFAAELLGEHTRVERRSHPDLYVLVPVAEDLGPLPETIRSRCQLVPFRRLSERAMRDEIHRRAPDLSDDEVTT